MVLIILSWMYILFTTINLGFGLDKIMKFKNDDFCITVFLGLFTTTIFTTIWALFGRINIEFHAVLLVANTIIFLKFQTDIKEKYFLFWKSITELSIALKWILFLISFLIIAQCAAAPYIIDNESYYIQTIKWINEYGFVKGLANLHIFFGQTSGWHIAQSAFNFSFIYKNFNDLSGFCLLIGTVFSILKLEKFFSNSDKNYLIIGLVPLANVFFFQFISAPSPDIPIYILTFIVFFYVLKNFKTIQISDYNLITTLVLFTLFIKTTSIALLLFPLVLFIFNFKKIVRNLVPIGFLGALVFILFIVKNTIITGYPFFPTRTFGLMNLDFGVPQNVISFYFNETKLYGFFLTKEEFHSMSFLEIFIKWLLSSKINGFFNILTVLILSVTPYFIYKYQNKKAVWFVYLVVIIQLIILLITSPQYRFFIHLTLFFSFLIFSSLFHQRKIILFFYTISVLITCVVLFIPMEFNALTSNKFISKNSSFTSQSILIPHSNSKTISAYYTVSKGNLKYYSPIENSFFWGTGNGNLPCVNKEQLDYFEKYLLVYPQQRTTNLKDGFYAKKKLIQIKLTKSELKSFLDEKVELYNNPKFIESDPIQIPHQFSSKEDIEIAAFLSATIAWGNRKMIISNAQKLMTLMGNTPFDFVMNHSEYDLERLENFVHRTFNAIDLVTFIKGLQHIYTNHGGLENIFTKNSEMDSMKKSISEFKKTFFEINHQIRTQKHISDPMNNSAAKRINMFLRWMVRNDKKGVDFGIWKNISPAALSCPLDVHSGNVARKLNLLLRKQNDAKALFELDKNLRELDKNDPVKYDFALFGLGVFEKF